MIKAPIAILAAAVALPLLLSACVSSATATQAGRTPGDWLENPPDPSAAQLKLLEGGVDEADYRAGFQNFQKCMTDAGHELFAIQADQTVIAYSIPSEAVNDGSYQLCYPQEFSQIDLDWQNAHSE